jgi:N-acetylneuraminic acid mutarotase
MNRAWACAILLVLTFAMSNPSNGASWEQMPSISIPSGNFACGTFGIDLVIAGGVTWKDGNKIWLDQIRRFDTKKKIWNDIGKLPHPIAYPAYAPTADGIFFAGGGDSKKTFPEIALLNHEFQFKNIGTVLHPLVLSGSSLVDGKLYVAAGAADAADLKTATNFFYSIELKTGQVENLPVFPGGNLIIPCAAGLNGKIYCFTGASFDAANSQAINSNSAFVYAVAEKKWSAIQRFPYSVHGLASCVLDDRHILLGGGYKQEFTDEAFIYDTKTDRYFKTKPLPYRAMAHFIKAGDDLYWLGGEDAMRHRSALVYRTSWRDLLRETLAEK